MLNYPECGVLISDESFSSYCLGNRLYLWFYFDFPGGKDMEITAWGDEVKFT